MSPIFSIFLCLLPVAMARSDMLRISGLVDDRHICTQAEAPRCHSQAEAHMQPGLDE